MRILKKYPNRRLYDTQDSVYVTLDDVRKMVLNKDPLQIVDSKTGKDLTRSVFLQIISEQEAEGHEPLLTNRVLQQIIRFYGDSMQGVLSKYIEQSIMTFLDQQEMYQRRMREVLNANPLKLMQRLADQNISFLRSMLQPGDPGHTGDSKAHNELSEVHNEPSSAASGDETEQSVEPSTNEPRTDVREAGQEAGKERGE